MGAQRNSRGKKVKIARCSATVPFGDIVLWDASFTAFIPSDPFLSEGWAKVENCRTSRPFVTTTLFL